MLSAVSCRACSWALRCLASAGVAVLLSAGGTQRAGAAGYLVDVWDTENNLPSSTVTSIIQTPEGYLWVGTYNGLARFDGVRFVIFDQVNEPALNHSRIQGLYLDAAGTLWIDTYRGGLTSYRDGVFRNEWKGQTGFDLHTTLAWSSSNVTLFATQFGEVLRRTETGGNPRWESLTPPGNARLGFQCADAEGRLWFLARDGHIVRFVEGRFEDLPPDACLGNKRIYTLVTDPEGRIWAGAENEIACWDGARFESRTPTNGEPYFTPALLQPTRSGAVWVLTGERLRKMADRQWQVELDEWHGLLGWESGRAMGAHEDRDGGIWFNHYGNGLFHIAPDGKCQRLTMREGLPSDRVGAWFQSTDGGVWAGMTRGGLARLRDRRFQAVGQAEGLPARVASSVCEDADGTVWIGTGGAGVSRWREGTVASFSVGGSSSENFVFCLFPRTPGGLWMSAGESEVLQMFEEGQVQRAPLEIRSVKSILADHAGRVWVGTKVGLAWWSANGRKVFTTLDGAELPAIRALAEAPDGTIWSGSDDGTLYRCESERLEAFRPHDALAEQPICSLLADDEGVLWAGTFRGGLLRFHEGRFTRLTARQGLPVDVVCQLLEDGQGRLWLGTHQGIYCVSKTALNACAEGRTNRVDCVTYGRHEGLPALEFSDGYQPACWRARDGRLWFTTVRGAVWMEPDAFTAKSLPPPVVLEEMRVDGTPVTLRKDRIVIPPGHKQFEFQFTALSFNAGNLCRFRYRLEGMDVDWVEAGTHRTVHYGYLAPNNDYRFRVIACNNEGVWNETGASVAFTVRPYFYETRWFIALASLGVIGGVAGGVRAAASRKYRRKLALLEQQHAIERDRTRIAKDIHDDIGAGLTQITLLTELARREPEQVAPHLERISNSARQLTRAMDEIVWAVDPQHDTFSGLLDYISAYAEDFLRMAGIRCRMDLPNTLPALRVDAELRYNLFLATKEALNNIVKHAQATEVRLRLQVEPKTFTLVIEDNGQGLPVGSQAAPAAGRSDRIKSGSGLPNLEKRLAAIGGRCEVRSAPGRGTRVEMTVALNGGASPIVAIGPEGRPD
jgi:signal transduction histidine kinase/ligand-binding sensor domain-containing protein